MSVGCRQVVSWLFFCLLFLALMATPALGEAAFSALLSENQAGLITPSCVSADGNVVAGVANVYDASENPFIWTPSTGLLLPALPEDFDFGEANGISADGTIMAGTLSSAETDDLQGFLWTPQQGFSLLPFLDPGLPVARVNGLAADGLVVVGQSSLGPVAQAVRWVKGEIEPLGNLPGLDSVNSAALAASHDGSVIVGNVELADGTRAFRWEEQTGMNLLSDLESQAKAVSPEGAYVVGQLEAPDRIEAVRWGPQGAITLLGTLPSNAPRSAALAASAEGGIVVGSSDYYGAEEAFIWTASGGIQRLADFLIAHGAGMQIEGWRLQRATAISPDGLTIVGDGYDPLRRHRGWRVEPGTS